MVPSKNVWNYAFMGSEYDESLNYTLKLDIPLHYYDELHRAIHFSQFKDVVEVQEDSGTYLEDDQEDLFLM
ncbi:unnamed protein product [Hanseniaspora opuntiae]